MNKARIAVLAVAILAAGGAGLMATKMLRKEPEKKIVKEVKPAIKLEQVLIATTNIPMGTRLKPDMLRWQDWPQQAVGKGFIAKSKRGDARETLAEAVTRTQIYEGEPVLENKIVEGKKGVMSAILPKGQRAVATSISTATSAGGFVLPNDRVDVLMTTRQKESDTGFKTEVILENIRVLAIDQTIQEKDGSRVVVGETATLQLTPKQVEILAVAQQTAERLSLALRSLEDAEEPVTVEADYLLDGGKGSVRFIRYGKVRVSSAKPSGVGDATTVTTGTEGAPTGGSE